MAEVKPFRALRYDEAKAGPLDTLVAPPYDVIGPEERAEFLARSPYNIVHLTLPDHEEEAARDLANWRAQRILAEEEPSYWALEQHYTGPDGIARTRRGIVVALRIEPYEKRIVLPHERTHAAPKEGRLRLLRATRTQLEPIFLLYDGSPVEPPDREPDLAVGGDRLWQVDEAAEVDELLIADGHHRYETALAFHEEDGTEASAWMMVVLVSREDEGLEIFPTHRVAKEIVALEGTAGQAVPGGPYEGLRELQLVDGDRPAALLYRKGETLLLVGDEPELDVAFVERLGLEGVSYTPSADEAVAAVDSGAAEAAVLMRPTRIEQVVEMAERGETMPQKSTYFYPKLTSGLLLFPLD